MYNFRKKTRGEFLNILIKIFDDIPINQKRIFFSNQYFSDIENIFPEIKNANIENVDRGILYYAKNIDEEKNAIEIKFDFINVQSSSIEIKFSIIRELDVNSKTIRGNAYHVSRREDILDEDTKYLPVISLFDDNEIDEITREHKLKTQKSIDLSTIINKYKEDNDWEKIYASVQPIESIKDNYAEIWEDYDAIWDIAYACGKLSEIDSNNIKKVSDMNQVAKILNKSNKALEDAIALFNRCLEIQPYRKNTILSCIAYLYYNRAISRASKYIDINECVKKTLEYYNEILSNDENRIKDHYRKAKLLLDVQAQNMKYNKGDFKERRKIEELSCEHYRKVITLWQELDSSEKGLREKTRTKKEYIKTLYNLGVYYLEKPFNKWEELVNYLLSNKCNFISASYSTYDINDFNTSKTYFESCWSMLYEDNICFDDAKINLKCSGWYIDAFDILYRYGELNTFAYLSIKETETDYMSKREQHFNIAEQAFQAGLKIKNIKYKAKIYIPEKLARLYILKGEYRKAIDIIEQCPYRQNDHYVINTIALAYFLQGNMSKVKSLLAPINNNRNKCFEITKKIYDKAVTIK